MRNKKGQLISNLLFFTVSSSSTSLQQTWPHPREKLSQEENKNRNNHIYLVLINSQTLVNNCPTYFVLFIPVSSS